VNQLVLRLHGQHPYDVGILAVYLLNCFSCTLRAAWLSFDPSAD
jgi:hypothetical protein